MRSRQPGDTLFNVRRDGFDPRTAVPVDHVTVELAREPNLKLVSWRMLQQKGGPVSNHLAQIILDSVPREEHNLLRFTARSQVFQPGDFPAETPPTWHTDFARKLQSVERRLRIHTYAITTGEPRTRFLQAGDLWLPDPIMISTFNDAIAATAVTVFDAAPWSLVRFNATELHTAQPWHGDSPTERLFFRATYDKQRVMGMTPYLPTRPAAKSRC